MEALPSPAVATEALSRFATTLPKEKRKRKPEDATAPAGKSYAAEDVLAYLASSSLGSPARRAYGGEPSVLSRSARSRGRVTMAIEPSGALGQASRGRSQ